MISEFTWAQINPTQLDMPQNQPTNQPTNQSWNFNYMIWIHPFMSIFIEHKIIFFEMLEFHDKND